MRLRADHVIARARELGFAGTSSQAEALQNIERYRLEHPEIAAQWDAEYRAAVEADRRSEARALSASLTVLTVLTGIPLSAPPIKNKIMQEEIETTDPLHGMSAPIKKNPSSVCRSAPMGA